MPFGVVFIRSLANIFHINGCAYECHSVVCVSLLTGVFAKKSSFQCNHPANAKPKSARLQVPALPRGDLVWGIPQT